MHPCLPTRADRPTLLWTERAASKSRGRTSGISAAQKETRPRCLVYAFADDSRDSPLPDAAMAARRSDLCTVRHRPRLLGVQIEAPASTLGAGRGAWTGRHRGGARKVLASRTSSRRLKPLFPPGQIRIISTGTTRPLIHEEADAFVPQREAKPNDLGTLCPRRTRELSHFRLGYSRRTIILPSRSWRARWDEYLHEGRTIEARCSSFHPGHESAD